MPDSELTTSEQATTGWALQHGRSNLGSPKKAQASKTRKQVLTDRKARRESAREASRLGAKKVAKARARKAAVTTVDDFVAGGGEIQRIAEADRSEPNKAWRSSTPSRTVPKPTKRVASPPSAAKKPNSNNVGRAPTPQPGPVTKDRLEADFQAIVEHREKQKAKSNRFKARRAKERQRAKRGEQERAQRDARAERSDVRRELRR